MMHFGQLLTFIVIWVLADLIAYFGTKFELIFGQEELTLSSPHHTRSGRVYTGADSVLQPDVNVKL